jgi:hypothetical protein
VNEILSLFLKLPKYWTVSGKEDVKMEIECFYFRLTWLDGGVRDRGEQECERGRWNRGDRQSERERERVRGSTLLHLLSPLSFGARGFCFSGCVCFLAAIRGFAFSWIGWTWWLVASIIRSSGVGTRIIACCGAV